MPTPNVGEHTVANDCEHKNVKCMKCMRDMDPRQYTLFDEASPIPAEIWDRPIPPIEVYGAYIGPSIALEESPLYIDPELNVHIQSARRPIEEMDESTDDLDDREYVDT